MLTSDMQAPGEAGTLEAITALKKDFTSKFDRVLTAINEIKSVFKDFAGRLGQAEDQIGDMEDVIASEKTKVVALEKQVCELTSKIDDLENRNRRSSLRLVNLPGRKLKKAMQLILWKKG